MFLPHPGDFTYCFLWRLNQKLILFLAILPVLLKAVVKRAEKRGRMGQEMMQAKFSLVPTPPNPPHSTCANIQTVTLTAMAFTYYKYLHPLHHSLFFNFVLHVQAQIFSF